MRYMVAYGTYCVPPTATGNYGTLRAETIANAMRAATTREAWGSWVGPSPRITRGRFDPCIHQVHAAWLLAYPDPDPSFSADDRSRYDDVIRRELRERLSATMRAADAGGPGWDFSFLPYDETLYGPVSWWESGEAARTRTYQSPDSGARENATGPDSVHPEEIGAMDALSRWVREHKMIVVGAGVLTGLGVAAYLIGKAMDAGLIRGPGAYGPPPMLPPPVPYGMPIAGGPMPMMAPPPPPPPQRAYEEFMGPRPQGRRRG